MSLFAEDYIKKFFNRFYFSQRADDALKYAPIVSELKKAKLIKARILEVDPGDLGITPYLKVEIDGLDRIANGSKNSQIKRIKASGNDLPFKKDTYDVTICADVLEHIDKSKREEFIHELMRITKRLILITVPCGDQAQNQDAELSKIWEKVYKRKNTLLEDHLKKGLPSVDEMLVYIDKSKRSLKKNAKVRSYTSLNLIVRKIILRTGITKNKYLYFTYKKGYLLLVPIIKLYSGQKAYRRVFVIEFA